MTPLDSDAATKSCAMNEQSCIWRPSLDTLAEHGGVDHEEAERST